MLAALQSRLVHFVVASLMLCVPAVHAVQDPLEPPILQSLGMEMEEFPYPYPVEYLPLTMEGQMVKMAYMDVAPAGKPNGRNALLLHGRNFGGYYWENTIRFLSNAGYRVVVPDQIGFGKSSKPDIGLSFHALAHNTRQLLDHLGIDRTAVIAHSMGGMLAVRFALMFPEKVEKLILESPIGLEDYRLKVPYATNEELARESAAMTRESIDRFYRSYFAQWRPEFQVYADVQFRWTLGPEAGRLHRTAAHTYQMAYEQPVVYELPLVQSKTLIVGGDADRSAIGRNRVAPEVRDTMGRFTELIPAAARAMPDATPVLLSNVGHIAHLEIPEKFHTILSSFLGK
jgi:pimeloyl-ACP methyl ester carboxylesterase